MFYERRTGHGRGKRREEIDIVLCKASPDSVGCIRQRTCMVSGAPGWLTIHVARRQTPMGGMAYPLPCFWEKRGLISSVNNDGM
jgi:hypothetical protein